MPAGIRAPSRLAFALLVLAGLAAWYDALAEGGDLFAPSREIGQTMDDGNHEGPNVAVITVDRCHLCLPLPIEGTSLELNLRSTC
jgi:hypothetical protein